MREIKLGDYIAFGFNYNGGVPDTLIVDRVSAITTDEVLVHFMYGYKSMAEYIKISDIIAIVDENGKDHITGYSSRFTLLKPNHYLI